MTFHELFGPRGLGWRPTTARGWAVLWGAIITASLVLFAILRR